MHIPSSPKLMPSNFADGDPTDVIQLIHRQGGGDDAGGGAMGLALPFTGFLGHDHRPAARVTIMTSMLIDRKSVVKGKSVSVRVDLGGRRLIKKKKLRQANAREGKRILGKGVSRRKSTYKDQ